MVSHGILIAKPVIHCLINRLQIDVKLVGLLDLMACNQ